MARPFFVTKSPGLRTVVMGLMHTDSVKVPPKVEAIGLNKLLSMANRNGNNLRLEHQNGELVLRKTGRIDLRLRYNMRR